MATETKTFYPQACEDYKVSNSAIDNPTDPVGKGSDNTTYAGIYAYWATSYAYWPFDVSVIPEDAVIDSIECKAKAKINSTSYANASLQIFSGDTAKGSATTFKSTTATVYSLTTGTWTRAELDSIRLKTEVTSTKANGITLYFYGADLTVNYTYNAEKFMLKTGGAWADVARVFKKVNGIWVEQTDLANVIEDGVRYQNGGEYVNPYKTVTITGTGHDTYCYVVVDGIKYTSAATLTLETGTLVECVVDDQYTSKPACYVKLDGTKVLNAQAGTYRYVVEKNSVINLTTGKTGGWYCGYIDITTQ